MARPLVDPAVFCEPNGEEVLAVAHQVGRQAEEKKKRRPLTQNNDHNKNVFQNVVCMPTAQNW